MDICIRMKLFKVEITCMIIHFFPQLVQHLKISLIGIERYAYLSITMIMEENFKSS